LLRRLLDSHSRISCGPEIKFFRDFYGDFIGDPLAHARFLRTVRSLGLTDTECLRILGPAFVACHELAARKLGKPRWADKNPENVLYLDQWRTILPEGFAFVHVVRNPYDALASLKEIRFSKVVPEAFEAKAALYLRYAKAGMKFCEEHPDVSMTIAYEELVRRPQDVLTRLLQRLGESFEPQMLERFHLAERRPGLEDPHVTKRADVHTESIGRWKSLLTDHEQSAIRHALRELPLGPSGEWVLNGSP